MVSDMAITGKLAKDLAKKHGVKMPKKRSKYGAVKTTVDGIRFDSKKEAKRYVELMDMQKMGMISDLQLQPSYPIVVNGIEVCEYRADFFFRRGETEYVEDTKGFRTPVYKLKKKLVEAMHGIKIFEV